ncbi:MAG: TIGR02677 family protein [Lachnospiraceae bacterium]|nr:TIGR02677 family protein [Lachnospiraceae bacterium]
MKIHDKLKKPIQEARYLNVENTDRYRSILRLFYLNYEKLKYWMYQENVYEELTEDPYFSTYTMEQCQQDLSALVSWGNLATIQDTRKVATLEEFNNKKFHYQLTETAVEIERMVIRLENLFIEGSSLEPTLLERLKISLLKVNSIAFEEGERVYGWWNDLNNDFIRLNQNYQDYMRELNSVKAEEMMKTREFLVFKDRLIEYLRSFVKALQVNATTIEQSLRQADRENIKTILKKVTEYELSIPRIDVEIDADEIYERMKGRWDNIYQWFIGIEGAESESVKVFDTTNEIIRKITRYATRLSEQNNRGANRREEYRKLSKLFAECGSIYEAHCLSAVVFGIEKPLHLKGDILRKTESFNSGIYDEEPHKIVISPRVREYRQKAKRSGIIDKTAQKEAVWLAEVARLEEERKLREQFIQGNYLDFSTLPEITPQVRDVFLMWLSKGLETKALRAKTEDGKQYYIEEKIPAETCVLRCIDGTFRMPAYRLIFEDED